MSNNVEKSKSNANKTMSALVIRKATKSDLSHIYPMWELLTFELPRHHFSPFGPIQEDIHRENLLSTLGGCLSRVDAAVFVAELGPVCGTLSVIRNVQTGYASPESAVLFNLWVDDRMRRRGVARSLVKQAKQWLSSQGVSSVQVGWHPENKAANAFWLSQGFRHYECIAAVSLQSENE